jgi:RimJ/RimL family protein N-acetyltransferase
MDLIVDFPEEKVAYIGFFMVEAELQGKGIGTEVITDCMEYLKELGYQKVRLAIDEGNPQSHAFWRKNLFQ